MPATHPAPMPPAQPEPRDYAAAAVAAYRAQLLAEFRKRHEQEQHRHNWWACLAREIEEGKL